MTDPVTAGASLAQSLQEAMSCHQQGRLSEAETSYERVLDLEPHHEQALRLAGILARERGELSRSVERLKRLVELSDDAISLGELALTHMTAGDLARADRYFRRALACDRVPYNAIANFGALLQRRGHIYEAIEQYRRCLESDPDDLEVRCNLASALLDAGEGEEALQECDAALAMSPGNPVLLANQGAVLCGLEDYERAGQVLEQVMSSGFVEELSMINLGFTNSRRGEVDAAVDILTKATNAYPDSARAVADLANALVAAGQIDMALEHCESFLSRCPGERVVLANYAYALRDAGRVDEARAILDYASLIAVRDIGPPGADSSGAGFNEALADYIRGHSSLLADPVRKATTGGSQTGELDFSDSIELGLLEDMFNDCVRAMVQTLRETGFSDHPAMACAADEWSLRAWATVLQPGGHQTPHLHPVAWLSGVYYVQVPDEPGSAGGLEFGPAPAHLVVNSAPEKHLIEPREGRLVVFPSYFYHRTQPFASEQDRISIAFDVVPGSV